MNGTRRHAPHTTDRFAPATKLAQANASEARPTSRGNNRRLSVVASQSPSHHIAIPDRISLLPLAALDLSVVLFNIFRRAGVSTVGQVLEMEQEDLEHIKLGERSIQEVARQVQAMGVLAPAQCLLEEFLFNEPSTTPADPDLSADLTDDALDTHDVFDDAITLQGHRYAWTVLINVDGWQKREQWYLDFAPSCFPYPPGTLIEHDAQYYVLNAAGSSMLRVTSFFQDEEDLSDEEELLEEGSLPQTSFKLPDEPRPRRFCYEVSVSCLPPKYQDRISRRQRTCWIETPYPASIRPGYFVTRIGSTPDQVRGKRPVFLTEEEATALAPVSQAQVPTIKVAPAFLLPEDLRQVISSGISRPMDLWESEGAQPSLMLKGTGDMKSAGQPKGEHSSMRVPVPRHVARMFIHRLGLSLPLAHRLQLAGITRVGQLVEMEEDALRALSIGQKSLREIACCLQAVQALPSKEALVYDDIYLAVTDQCSTDEQGNMFRMVYVSIFPDRLAGWRSGLVHTVWLLQEHIDLAMDWDRSLSSLDTHTLRVQVNEHARAQGAVAPPPRTQKRKQEPEELDLSASKNLRIRLDATDGLLDTLPPGEETRRYRDRTGLLFGLEQEEWLALGRQAAEWRREQYGWSGHQQEAFALEQVAACIKQVEGWYAELTTKPRILGLCGAFVEDEVPRERTFTIREKGRPARRKMVHWTEKVKRLVGYDLVVGAPKWISWPDGWAQKPGKQVVEEECAQNLVEQAQ